jgi:nucleoside-diphosphate-sugar epimerase
MKIAILGATSEIAKDLILSFSAYDEHELVLFARRPKEVMQWLSIANLSNKHAIYDFESFHHVADLDAIINFVGAGDPSKAIALGNSILEITEKYDYLVLDYLKENPRCKYIFISSGAVYGQSFVDPVYENTEVPRSVNLDIRNFYAIAKLRAEERHRALTNFNITDLRIFSYFSHTQNPKSRFFMSDVVNALKNRETLVTSSEDIVRDYLSSSDFYQIIEKILYAFEVNMPIDCYSRSPVSKFKILSTLGDNLRLDYKIEDRENEPNPISSKKNYYSLKRDAEKIKYVPTLSSLELITQEINKYLNN